MVNGAGDQMRHRSILTGHLTAATAIGPIPIGAGFGFPTIHGGGRHFIMVAGSAMQGTAGFGCRGPNGGRHG